MPSSRSINGAKLMQTTTDLRTIVGQFPLFQRPVCKPCAHLYVNLLFNTGPTIHCVKAATPQLILGVYPKVNAKWLIQRFRKLDLVNPRYVSSILVTLASYVRIHIFVLDWTMSSIDPHSTRQINYKCCLITGNAFLAVVRIERERNFDLLLNLSSTTDLTYCTKTKVTVITILHISSKIINTHQMPSALIPYL